MTDWGEVSHLLHLVGRLHACVRNFGLLRIEPSGGMGLRNLIDSAHEGGSPHRDFLLFCKAKCPMEGRGNEFMKSLLNVTLIPEKMLDVLDPTQNTRRSLRLNWPKYRE